MRYGYAGLNPVVNSDPSGLLSNGAAVGVAVAGVTSVGVGLVALSSFKLSLMRSDQNQAWNAIQPIAQTLGVEAATYQEVESKREPGYIYFIHSSNTASWAGATGINYLSNRTGTKDFGPAFYTFNPAEPLALPSAASLANIRSRSFGGSGFIVWVKIRSTDFQSLKKFDLRMNYAQWLAVTSSGNVLSGNPGFIPDLTIGPIASVSYVDGVRTLTQNNLLAHQYAFHATTAGKLTVAFVTPVLPHIAFNQSI
jgi:hypothetical protein